MGLNHDFMSSKIGIVKYQAVHEGVKVGDNLMSYMLDSLQWIDTEWNELGNRNRGLNYYGITIFRGDSLKLLMDIVSSWVNLFQHAPSQFTMTGDFQLDSNTYEKIEYQKAEVIAQLTKLVEICEAAWNNDIQVVHFGI
ncbi:hypothetical protein [Listeria booriae]|uniref:hypothetical protein n=1 Tax=Listeria booriae TaxID=1552123 RepID=UPI0016273F25|nr:hypothetical protein [Listeria booriae]MBC2172094.1 hypothetical protein [Listeria booriae]